MTANNVFLLIVLAACSLLSLAAGQLVELGGRKYYVTPVDLEALPTAAEIICNDFNMTLVSMESLEEAALIKDYLLTNGFTAQYWTSGRYLNEEWTWTGSGQVFTEVEWYPGQPSQVGYGYDLCVYVWHEGKLYDEGCYLKYGFICEQRN